MVQETFEIQAIPAIMPASFEDLREKLERVASFVPLVQIDICDGKVTPRPTWPYQSSRRRLASRQRLDDVDEDFERIIKEDQGLPFWDSVNFEIDLFVQNPEDEVEKWIQAGASRIIIHIEQTKTEGLLEFIGEVRKRGVEMVIASDVDTPNEELTPFLDTVDGVQFMGIVRTGEQGQPFEEKVLEKIKNLRESHPDLHIAVDGGVNLDNANAVVGAGADRLVAGSAIFESENVEDAINAFQNLLY